MHRYVVRCLHNTSSVPHDIEVYALDLDQAMRACRNGGFWPVKQCLVSAS